ncbi:MAG: FHA domain-containing serine/threonine-protein kinase, partial [Acidobacteriota bacterium]
AKPGIFEERSPYNDESISKPFGELEDTDPPKSMFDSVRIMESKPQEDVDTRIQGASIPPVSAPAPEEPQTTASEPKSHTEPNLGRGDTDGKRGGKLKPLSEGIVLNARYEIVRKIGGGGMGAVYLASDNNLGGVLRAVKEMVQSHIEEEQQEKAINDFKRESMILSTLDHASIPTIYDYFYDADEGRFYLVMKYISGGDLSSRLRSAPEGKIDEKSVTQWAIQVTDVLDYLHSQPSTIVYRDLKPSNIMLDGNSGRVMLIDFGIARAIGQKEEKGVTAVGTMGYAPPELFSGNVEPRSDVYSLGSTMFHLLTGADPQSNPLLIFDFQKNPRPRQINSLLSDQMERIIMRAVEYNADSRFSSAAEMKAVLEEHIENLRTGNVTYGVTAVPASISLENQSVFCGFCGQRIVATDLFCAFCGAKQPIAQQGVHSEIYSRSGNTTAKLIIEGTSELATPTFSLQKDENLVGRRDPMSNIFPEVDLSKYDPQTKISRRHARIWRDGVNFLVEDLGSSNGTVVDSPAVDAFRLVPHKPHVLASGDKLKVGDTTLHFLVG